MTTEELLRPRYKVIADYPGNGYNVGDVICEVDSILQKFVRQGDDRNFQYIQYPGYYPANFKALQWWEERKPEEMPEYVKLIGVGCTIEKDGVVKVFGVGIFVDNGKNLGNEGQPYVLIEDKYKDEYGYTRLNCRNCIPATLEEYEAYLQSQT